MTKDLALPASSAPPGRGELGTAAFGDTGEVWPSDPNQFANLQQQQSDLQMKLHTFQSLQIPSVRLKGYFFLLQQHLPGLIP